ncbi:MAG: hypothetical protein ACI9JN_001053 [Bacteroidia bacterium]|jgi:hypothetical protein
MTPGIKHLRLLTVYLFLSLLSHMVSGQQFSKRELISEQGHGKQVLDIDQDEIPLSVWWDFHPSQFINRIAVS